MTDSLALRVLGGAFVLLGGATAAYPTEMRDFLQRQMRFVQSKKAADRYAQLPRVLFRALGVAMLCVGIVLGAFAATGR
jgi:hypothetical protein